MGSVVLLSHEKHAREQDDLIVSLHFTFIGLMKTFLSVLIRFEEEYKWKFVKSRIVYIVTDINSADFQTGMGTRSSYQYIRAA